MHLHPHFNLCLHDNEELASLLQSGIVERVTLHEWPLSCVQRLTLADGRRLVYKVQFGPTVESGFYANARSALLPAARTVYESNGHVCMLIEFVDALRLEDLRLPEQEAVRIGRHLLAQIAEIEGELPYYYDVSDEERWETFVRALLADLRALIAQRKFRRADGALVRALERWAFSEPARSAIRAKPGYVHHDLTGDNVFVVPGGYRVIDWQRPIRGPADLDIVSLLESLGWDPAPHVDADLVQVENLLRIGWFTECAARWIPDGADYYDEQIVLLASRITGGS